MNIRPKTNISSSHKISTWTSIFLSKHSGLFLVIHLRPRNGVRRVVSSRAFLGVLRETVQIFMFCVSQRISVQPQQGTNGLPKDGCSLTLFKTNKSEWRSLRAWVIRLEVKQKHILLREKPSVQVLVYLYHQNSAHFRSKFFGKCFQQHSGQTAERNRMWTHQIRMV